MIVMASCRLYRYGVVPAFCFRNSMTSPRSCALLTAWNIVVPRHERLRIAEPLVERLVVPDDAGLLQGRRVAKVGDGPGGAAQDALMFRAGAVLLDGVPDSAGNNLSAPGGPGQPPICDRRRRGRWESRRLSRAPCLLRFS